jgi:hypothetical protein
MSDPINVYPAPDGFGSTYLNPRIESYGDLVYRVKSVLGYPATNIELADAQWASFIDEALEIATQFELGKKEEYLVFCSNLYRTGCGVKLDDLIQVGCNYNACYQTLEVESVTSTDISFDCLGTTTAYLSVTPFAYPTGFNYLEPGSVAFSGVSGQNMFLYYDPDNPWDANNICNADCVTIYPLSSQYYYLSANPFLSGMSFNFVDDTTLSSLASSVSAFIGDYPLSSVPLTALGDQLSAISPCYYDLSAFYPANYWYPPMSACVNIGHGAGYVYPNCNTTFINYCSALSAQFGLSPTWCHVLTSIPISTYSGNTTATDFAQISSFFENFCADCNCNCSSLFSFTSATSAYTYSVYKNVLSGCDGRVFDLSALDISDATHLKLYNVPSCTTDGSIPLNSNDGIVGSFTLCNSAISTNGPMYLRQVQFFKDFKPPEEALCERTCNWQNNGFTMTHHNSAYGECIRTTPALVKVDVSFCQKSITTNVGTVSTYLSGNVDQSLGRQRKVLGVFDIETGSQAGYGGFGGDLLFNFDYALLASTFGYDLQGSRMAQGKNGYDLLTYHMAKGFVENSRKMLRYVSYQFDPKTQYLKIMPEPGSSGMLGTGGTCNSCNGSENTNQCYIVGLYVEPLIQELLSEYWVREWVTARALWTLGRIRGKFAGVTLYGGVQILGEQLVSEANERMKELMAELREKAYYTAPAGFFIG